MTQLRIGFNINGANAGDTAAIVEWHRVNKPAWALVMDAAGLAAEIKTASPTTNVIIRVYSVDGEPGLGHEETAKTWTPDAFIAEAAKQQAGDVWIQVGNECGFSDELLDWTAQIIEKAAKFNKDTVLPLKLVVLNHAVGTPANINDWKRAAAVKVLKLASKYRDWCVIGLHEYFNIVPTSGFRGGNPTWIQPEDWPENPYTVGALWHCGRFQFALEACRENGISPYPRMVLTEHGTDDVSDIKEWVESFGQGTGRGWKHAAKLWALPSFYPGKPKEELFAGMLKYLDERLYRNSPVEGQLVFTINYNKDWQTFNAPEMLGHITGPIILPDTPPVEPPSNGAYPATPGVDDPRWSYRLAKPTGAFRVFLRENPTENSKSLGQVGAADIVAVISDLSLNHGDWRPVRYKENVGWMHTAYIRFVMGEEDTPPANGNGAESPVVYQITEGQLSDIIEALDKLTAALRVVMAAPGENGNG